MSKIMFISDFSLNPPHTRILVDNVRLRVPVALLSSRTLIHRKRAPLVQEHSQRKQNIPVTAVEWVHKNDFPKIKFLWQDSQMFTSVCFKGSVIHIATIFYLMIICFLFFEISENTERGVDTIFLFQIKSMFVCLLQAQLQQWWWRWWRRWCWCCRAECQCNICNVSQLPGVSDETGRGGGWNVATTCLKSSLWILRQ